MPDIKELVRAIDTQTYVLTVIAKELCLLVQDNHLGKSLAGTLIDEMERFFDVGSQKEAAHG